MQTWVIGCTHFDDPNIVQYRRAFSSLEQMNEIIARSWESRVAPKDLVYILGDFAVKRVRYWTDRLPGEKVLIVGNHDSTAALYTRGFVDVQQQLLVRLPPKTPFDRPRQLFLCHYPFVSWPEKGNGCVHLHAHSHGQGLLPSRQGMGPGRVDMSVECWETWPVDIDEAYHQGE